jgi:polysaccharide biosynthesis protein PslG
MRARLQRLAGASGLAVCALASLYAALAPARPEDARPPVARAPSATRAASTTRAPSTTRAASSYPLGGVNIGRLGYGSQPAQADREIAEAKQLGAKLVRIAVPWSVMQPRAAGQSEAGALAYTNRLTADAAAARIKLIVLVDSTPCWASSAPASLLRRCEPNQDGAANRWPPLDASAYATFVASLAQRYGTELAAIEIWNEPDQANELYFAGPDKAARYAALLRAAYTAIKRANAGVLVLGASIVGDNGKFLRLLYADGIKGFYDGLAVHFYTLTVAAVRYIHEVQLANGDSTPIWLDEFGFSSCWPRYRIQEEQGCVTERLQGVDLADIFRSLARFPYVAGVVMYKLQSSGSEDFGVLTPAGARKPSYTALAQVLASPAGEPSPVTLRLRRGAARVVAGGSGPPGDYMELEAYQGTVLRYRALFVLNRFNEYSIALPKVLGTSGLRVRVFQYGQGPARAAQRST